MFSKLHKNKRHILFNFLLLLSALILSFLAAEYIARIFVPQEKLMNQAGIYEISETRGLKFRPNAEGVFTNAWQGKKEYWHHFKINSKGLMDYEYEYEKPINTFRIVMLGDSMTAAAEVPLENTFENVLEKRLNDRTEKKYEKYEVLNLAVKGYDTAEEIITLEEEGFKYDPDIVVLNFYIGNDFWVNEMEPTALILENGNLVRRPNYSYYAPERFLRIRNFLYRHLSLYSLISQAIHSSPPVKEEAFSRYVEIIRPQNESRIGFKNNMTHLMIKELHRLLNEKNIPLILVIIPMKEQIDDKMLKTLLEEYNQTDMNVDLQWSIDKITEIGESENLPIINFYPEFKKQNKKLYFNSDLHMNEEGNRIAGEFLYEQLITRKIVE